MSLLFSLGSKLEDWFSPGIQRLLCKLLRQHKPVLCLGSQALVARHADVTAVLAESDRFGVTEVYADKMARTTGAFVLGMENTPLYAREVSWIRAAVSPADLARVRELARAHTDALLAPARAEGCIDVVSVARLVPLHLVDRYFGVPTTEPTQLLAWLRGVFWDLFVNLEGNPRVRRRALADATRLNQHLDRVIDEHQRALRAGRAPDDFITRLLQLRRDYPELDELALRRNVGGVIVGAVETQAKAIVQALEQLLRRPVELAGARAAAAAGDLTLVSRYVFEALRFHPHNPLIVRHCHVDTTLGAGTPHETLVRQGTTVYALTLSAMFDEGVVEDPERFRLDRPPHHYLHFGHGQHQCFGARLNHVVLPAVIGQLLLLPNLRISPATPRVEHEGPFPDRFLLEFDREGG